MVGAWSVWRLQQEGSPARGVWAIAGREMKSLSSAPQARRKRKFKQSGCRRNIVNVC